MTLAINTEYVLAGNEGDSRKAKKTLNGLIHDSKPRSSKI